jgi:hypothetical protein
MTKKITRAEQTELLDKDEPVLIAWNAVVRVLESINAPKTRLYRKPIKSKKDPHTKTKTFQGTIGANG